ncbi:MAG TPA: GAF domain-containing protein [Allocoleopsis sp.]
MAQNLLLKALDNIQQLNPQPDPDRDNVLASLVMHYGECIQTLLDRGLEKAGDRTVEVSHPESLGNEQAQLARQVQQLNADLERQMQERLGRVQQQMLSLQQALALASDLNRIANSLYRGCEESQILQITVLELTRVLGTMCCNAVLDDLRVNTSHILYAYSCKIPGYQGSILDRGIYPEIYQGLKHGQFFQFCSLVPDPVLGWVARVVCPIVDREHAIGYLWLMNPPNRVLSPLEVEFVQQIARTCAIAIGQARRYQRDRARITELENLNQLLSCNIG